MIEIKRRKGSAAISLGVLCLMSAAGTLCGQQRVAREPHRSLTMSPEMTTRLLSRPVTVTMDHLPLGRAIDLVTNAAGIRAQYDMAVVAQYTNLVTLHLEHVALGDALTRILVGTRLNAVPVSNTSIAIVEAGGELRDAMTVGGTVTGRIVDARTKTPLRGAKVGMEEVDQVAETAEDGTYRFANISPGSHTVTVKLLGYAKAVRTVIVQNDAVASVDFSLDLSATPLDQVVVTGMVIPTELKAVPNAMTVVTAKDIEQRGITHIDQLFRGDVPGLFSQNRGSFNPLGAVTMFSRGATALSTVSAGAVDLTNPIKTYVDGVELADPQYLSQIDPKSIERIEILTGPQASTIYGSNAINGVMQIFTKRGTSPKPQLTLNLLSGFVENNFSSVLTPQHDYSAQVNGIEGHLSYNAGSSWMYIGRWTPNVQIQGLNVSGGARLALPTTVGPTTIDFTLRRGSTQNVSHGYFSQRQTALKEMGYYDVSRANGVWPPTTSTATSQTLGLALTYAPTSWWSHEAGVGQDISEPRTLQTARVYRLGPSDSTLSLDETQINRKSQRYTTTAHVVMSSRMQTTVTFGVDARQSLNSTLRLSPQTLTGTLNSASTSITRRPEHNTGSFSQAQLEIADRLFLTYGLRAEWNPNYGEKAQPNYAPRYGIAYTQEFGTLTAKLRASYGRSTRPPSPALKTQVNLSANPDNADLIPYYGDIATRLPNPDLGPEFQQGGEGGVELYVGTRGSLVITRYNQTVNGLIGGVGNVDSARSLLPNPPDYFSLDTDGYGYEWQAQYLNIGTIRNQGWELQGSVNIGPFATRGTYSWTKSRTVGITPKYKSFFANARIFPQYQPGATFQYLAEHTWALGTTYVWGRTNFGLNVTGIGETRNDQNEFYLLHLNGARLAQNLFDMDASRYRNFNRGYAMADVTATRRLSTYVESVLQIQNLTDSYTIDKSAQDATLGRQVKAGLRLRVQ